MLSDYQFTDMKTTSKQLSSRKAMTDLVLEVFRLNGELLASGDALVANLGLTSARWQVMGAIALSLVPLPVAHLARNMGLARQSVQRLVDEMKRDGLVCLAPNQHHRRAMLVLLTEAGEAAYRAAMMRQERWADRVAVDFTTSEIETAAAILHRLRQRLDEEESQRSHQQTGADHGVC